MSVFTNDITVEAGSTNIPVTVSNFPATQPVSGSVNVSNFPATQPVSGTVAVTQSTSPWVVSGTVTSAPVSSSSATVAQITSTGANQVLLASNVNRKQAILYFTSGSWNIKYGAGASATSFTLQSTGAGTTIDVSVWTGEIDAVCTTSGKLVNVTEMV